MNNNVYVCTNKMNTNKTKFTLTQKSFLSLLKGRDSDGFLVFQEKFIRECIRKFPYCDATLLQQLVRSIAPVEIVSMSYSDLFAHVEDTGSVIKS